MNLGQLRATFLWLGGLLCSVWEMPPVLAADPKTHRTLTLEEGTFAVVTYKRGLMERFAHNHLVVAPKVTARITLPPQGENLAQGTFEATCQAKELVVDDPELQKKVHPRLTKAGIDVGFSQITPENRSQIFKNMIAMDQLWADKHPTIRVELKRLTEKPKDTWTHEGTLDMTVRGVTKTLTVPARVTWQGNLLEVEAALAKEPFKDFSIKPYSTLLGAVGNGPDFSLYAHFKALLNQTNASPVTP